MVVAARKPDGIDFVKNSKISSFCVNPPPTARYRTYGLIIPHSAAVGVQFPGAESIASEHRECAEEDLDIAGGKVSIAGRRRGRRHTRPAVCAGDRGCARSSRAPHRNPRNSTQPWPTVAIAGAGEMIPVTGVVCV